MKQFPLLSGLLMGLVCLIQAQTPVIAPIPASGPKKVYVIPVRDDIDEGIVYIIRRGIKEAIDNKADIVILQMNTYGGQIFITDEIFKILNKFPHQDSLNTYIDTRAGSAGSFIAAATHKIYMAPGAVIGAAAPVNSDGSDINKTMNMKIKSFVRGIVRAEAERQGHRADVFESMVDSELGLTIDGQEIVPKGNLLTLTSVEALKEYGNPKKTLLSSGTPESLESMIEKVAGSAAIVTKIEPTGFESIGRFIVMLSPYLLGAALLCGYLEFKTPGFGFFGILSILFALIFFFGQYIAGLSGYEYAILFVIGVALIATELLLFPGTILPGLIGLCLVLLSLLKAMVDHYPSDPFLPSAAQLQEPLTTLGLSLALSIVGLLLLIRLLPQTPLYGKMILATVNPLSAPAAKEAAVSSSVGSEGVSLTLLRPSGTADFGQGPVDVVTEGVFIEAGTRIRITERRGMRTVVEAV